VTIAPKVVPCPEWRHAKGDASRATRQNIIDGLKIDQAGWSGRLEDVESLQRLFNLESLPSNDSRFKDAAGDVWQHRLTGRTTGSMTTHGSICCRVRRTPFFDFFARWYIWSSVQIGTRRSNWSSILTIHYGSKAETLPKRRRSRAARVTVPSGFRLHCEGESNPIRSSDEPL
jgi:hypothetical protein